ncbi:PREDICTED: uncharacterized protein LOC105449756 [Wasmannia auropunctata]|uniref:uncharacterized protein LOC105449756 n=1 Tax=Wasmannia auropunctata TaxID=64793 RepID=UPI0005EEF400|nr:PREDICTED: uncharacterized protein LOC105449756 [Wasmannia auropunctata]
MKLMQLWWEGPEFLHHSTALHPFTSGSTVKDIPEKRITSLITQDAALKSDVNIIQRFSSFTRLKRVIAYCFRFKNNALSAKQEVKRKKGPLTVQETSEALTSILRMCQESEFQQELHDLRNKKPLNSKSKILTLHPFLDGDGLIHVGGRLRHAPIEFARKYPVILPKKHHLTELIIRDTHYRNLHAGSQAVLAAVRSSYWHISGKDAIRRVSRKCIVCYRTSPITAAQLMGNLPAHRVTQARPFLNTGVDYAGPFSIKISRNKTGKAYLSIFICLSTKAVHFELVPDLSAVSFLNAIKRLIARRGKCLNLYSDNSTTFVGANNQLLELKEFLAKDTTQSQLQEYLTGQFVNWKFIPPYSPHIGGLWEAAVKSAKTHMKRIIGMTPLTFEELLTILVQIEACLNSRPLTPISNDPTDLQALTPGHFIIGEALNAIPERDLIEVPVNRLTRYQLIIQMKRSFWSRWSQEYISQLQQRFKWKRLEDANIQIGTMVLIKKRILLRLPGH